MSRHISQAVSRSPLCCHSHSHSRAVEQSATVLCTVTVSHSRAVSHGPPFCHSHSHSLAVSRSPLFCHSHSHSLAVSRSPPFRHSHSHSLAVSRSPPFCHSHSHSLAVSRSPPFCSFLTEKHLIGVREYLAGRSNCPVVERTTKGLTAVPSPTLSGECAPQPTGLAGRWRSCWPPRVTC
eukprot:2894827-Pyramimonas_sp.AAC.1